MTLNKLIPAFAGVAPEMTYLDEAKSVGDFFAKGVGFGQNAIQLAQSQQKINNDMTIAQMQSQTEKDKLAMEYWQVGEQARVALAGQQTQMEVAKSNQATEIIKSQMDNAALLQRTDLTNANGIQVAAISHEADLKRVNFEMEQLKQTAAYTHESVDMVNRQDLEPDEQRAMAVAQYSKYAMSGDAGRAILQQHLSTIDKNEASAHDDNAVMEGSLTKAGWTVPTLPSGVYAQKRVLADQVATMGAVRPFMDKWGITQSFESVQGVNGLIGSQVGDAIKSGDISIDPAKGVVVKNQGTADSIVATVLNSVPKAIKDQAVKTRYEGNITVMQSAPDLIKNIHSLTQHERDGLASVTAGVLKLDPGKDFGNDGKSLMSDSALIKAYADKTWQQLSVDNNYTQTEKNNMSNIMNQQFQLGVQVARATVTGRLSNYDIQQYIKTMGSWSEGTVESNVQRQQHQAAVNIDGIASQILAPKTMAFVHGMGGIDAGQRYMNQNRIDDESYDALDDFNVKLAKMNSSGSTANAGGSFHINNVNPFAPLTIASSLSQ